jgi:pSer/pThr/pTyr-binding forkhead associated (FHA) protein
MNPFLEVWRQAGADLVQLDGDRLTVGRADGNDIVLADDGQVSRVHAVFERLAGAWSVRDVSSRNGTFVNGNRVSGEARVSPGDEVRIGRTRIVVRGDRSQDSADVTEAQAPPPQLTPRERDVLIALFRPMTGAEMFTEPASTRQIAQELWVSEAAVKQHLLRLYEKFGVGGEGERRRTRLANEALRRGAITLAEVRATTTGKPAT